MLDFLVVLETLYLSCDVLGNKTMYNDYLKMGLSKKLDELRRKAEEEGTYTLSFDNETDLLFEVLPKGIDRYKYGFSIRRAGEEFPIIWIYIAKKIGDNYPFYVKLSSRYLHLNSISSVLNEVKKIVNKLIELIDKDFYILTKDKPYLQKVSRIDICIHNKKFNINDYFSNLEELNTRVVTSIGLDKKTGKRNVKLIVELDGDKDFTIPYIMYMGKSVKLRMYNKLKEVIEMRNKTFFIPYWKDKGLITEEEFSIYDDVLRYTDSYSDYRVCFMFAHILRFVKSEEDRKKGYEIFYSKSTRDKKYEYFKEILNRNNVEMVKEIINIEYELHNQFLRTVKIINKETGQLIDFTSPEDLLKHINLLYYYLTTRTFRIINKRSRAKRKRAKKVDAIWEEIQKQKVSNIIGNEIEEEKLKFYRDYSKSRDNKKVVRRWLNNSSSLLYHLTDYITYDGIDNIDFIETLKSGVDNILRNDENFMLFRYDLLKKVKSYGEKKNKKNNPKNRAD